MEKTYYETHLMQNSTLPFIFHLDILENEKSLTNYHENIEVLYFIEGTGSIECNFIHTDVKKGDIFIVNSNNIHCISSSEILKYYCLITDNEFLESNGLNILGINFREKITDPVLNSIYERLVEEIWGNNPFKNAAIKSRILELFVYIARNCSVDKKSAGRDKLSAGIIEAIKYITANFTSHLTVSDIALKAGLSKYHFIRQFKKLTDYTLIEYINLLRCEKAKKLLAGNKYSIKEISEMCGFENFSYFSKTFKKCMGLSPSEYKMNFKEKNYN